MCLVYQTPAIHHTNALSVMESMQEIQMSRNVCSLANSENNNLIIQSALKKQATTLYSRLGGGNFISSGINQSVFFPHNSVSLVIMARQLNGTILVKSHTLVVHFIILTLRIFNRAFYA